MFICILLSSSFALSISVFSSGKLKIIGKIAVMLTISSLIGVFILQKLSPVSISSGQNNKNVIELTGRIMKDSREISGGFNIFPVKILYSENLNSTSTSSSGKLTIASKIVVYKGQTINIAKVNLLSIGNSTGFIDRKKITLLGPEKTWYAKILIKRKKILKQLKLEINRMHKDTAILFTALFTGYKINPNSELFLSFRRAGASHILALSGMHLGILSFGIIFLLKFITAKKMRFLITVLTILFYVFLTDSGPSLTRAAIFLIIIGIFVIIGIRTDIFHILVLCFIVQIIIAPESSYSLSFQLSYTAISGIILIGNKIHNRIPGVLPSPIRSILSASIAAQIFTAPLILYYFGVVYPVGIVSGIFLVPLVTIFIWTGIFSLLPFPWLIQKILFRIMDILYILISDSADFFSQFPFLVLKSAIYFFILFLSLYFVFFMVRNMFRSYTLAGSLLPPWVQRKNHLQPKP